MAYNQFNKDLHPSLFGQSVKLTKSNIPTFVGQFSEMLTGYIFRNKTVKIENDSWKPDFKIDSDYMEVKATSKEVFITEKQLYGCLAIQNEQFDNVYYFIYYYDMDRTCRSCSTSHELFQHLSQGIECAILLPVNIIYEFIGDLKRYEMGQWYRNDRFYYRVPREYIYNKLIKEKSVLIRMGDIMTNRFTIYKHISVEKKFKIEGNRYLKRTL